jgi:hypothetical protein
LLEHHMHNDTTTSHCWCQATMAIAWMKEACVLWCPSTTTQHETYFMPSLDVKMSFVPLIATGCVIFLPSCFQSHPLTIFSSTTKKKRSWWSSWVVLNYDITFIIVTTLVLSLRSRLGQDKRRWAKEKA